MALRYPAGFETVAELAGKLEEKAIFGLPDDFFTTYMDRVAKVTAADVARATAQWIDPRSVVVVVVGDRKKIEAGIKAAKLGPLRVSSVNELLGGQGVSKSGVPSPK